MTREINELQQWWRRFRLDLLHRILFSISLRILAVWHAWWWLRRMRTSFSLREERERERDGEGERGIEREAKREGGRGMERERERGDGVRERER